MFMGIYKLANMVYDVWYTEYQTPLASNLDTWLGNILPHTEAVPIGHLY